ncbi:MAG: hypothetical protein ACM3U1_11110 [Chloroflexota bacterium]
MRVTPPKRRRIVDIYFVLYLAALLFLLPDKKPADERSNQKNYSESFTLRAEKNALFAKAYIDSNGLNVISLDSVNYIYYSGDVEDVNYEFIIEDPAVKRRVSINSDEMSSTRYFRLIEDEENKSASFYWKPPADARNNAVYSVRVNAVAKSRRGADLLSERPQLRASAQFNLILNFYEKIPGSSALAATGETAGTRIDGGMGAPQFISTNFSFNLQNYEIRALAGQRWQNSIFSAGADLKMDLSEAPKIRINNTPQNNGGTVYLKSLNPGGIVLEGVAPSYGESRVNVAFRQKFTGREVEMEFKVAPQMLKSPQYDKVMYPDRNYTIQLNMPFVSGQESSAQLKSGDGRNVYASSEGGGELAFTPSASDTGKTIYLERYVDGKLFGQRYPIQIKSYPPPEVVRLIDFGAKTVRLQTAAYGAFAGRENYVVRLELEGNARYRELNGQATLDRASMQYVQIFEITPIDTEKPFEFNVTAVDRRGSRSAERKYH